MLPAQSGAKDANGKKFNASWKVIFFGCGCTVVFGALLGLWELLMDIIVSPFDIIVLSYLLTFGLIMLVLDSPVPHPKLEIFKLVIYKYLLFLTRFIGRGVTYIFLGCMLCGSLWDNGTAPFIGFIIFGALFVIGCASIYFGYKTTKKLESVRKALLNRTGPTTSLCPPGGLKTDKFADMAIRVQGIHFSEEELGYIANALSLTVHSDDIISQREFENWLKDPTTVLL